MSVSRKNSGLFSNNLSDKNFIDQVVKRAEAIYKDYAGSSDHNKIAGYDANIIAGTHLIAGSGPMYSPGRDIEAFIKNILFNDDLAVEQVIAIDKDYADYYSDENNNKKMHGQYQLDAKIKSGDLTKAEFIKSELTICDTATQKIKHVDVTIIPLCRGELNCHAKGSSDSRDFLHLPLELRLEELWKLYQDTQTKNTMIHCLTGSSRTGNVVVTFELMREYDKVFASGNPDIIATEAMAVLTRIRQSRPALVRNYFEFSEAIRSAYYLHRYGLEKTALLSCSPTKNNKNYEV